MRPSVRSSVRDQATNQNGLMFGFQMFTVDTLGETLKLFFLSACVTYLSRVLGQNLAFLAHLLINIHEKASRDVTLICIRIFMS